MMCDIMSRDHHLKKAANLLSNIFINISFIICEIIFATFGDINIANWIED